MNKTELVAKIAEKAEIKKVDADGRRHPCSGCRGIDRK